MENSKRLLAYELELKNFRSFHDVSIPLGDKITVISGVNGVGKSNIISLIASGSGLSRKSQLGSNFQPEFSDFFNIDIDENYQEYKMYLKYKETDGTEALVKRLSFKDDTPTNRGIRIIPRTIGKDDQTGITQAAREAMEKYGVGGSGRVKIPTIYLSLSRLYPLGERTSPATVNKMKKSSPFAQSDIMEKYREWYNYVIPNSICRDTDISVINKQACSRASLRMDIENTPTLSQSIGQDNIGNIISALIDIYRLSQQDNYNGAMLCIDEVEVSLHPDTQIKLLDLLEKLSDELKIQVIVSTHSLTVLKECLAKEEKSGDSYKVIYLKNPSSPFVTERKTYELLKADLFGNLQFNKVRVRMYFEDNIGAHLFKLLMTAYQRILFEIKNDTSKVLRNANQIPHYSSINERIISLENTLSYLDNLNIIVTHLGCDVLMKVSKVDTYFKRVIIMLDADARITGDNKPRIKEYLDRPFNPRDNGLNEVKHTPNIIFPPGFFAPESFLFKIIRTVYIKPLDHSAFWRSMDSKEDTSLYTSDKIKGLFTHLPDDFINDDLKGIFGEDLTGEIWKFIDKSDILTYFYFDYKTVPWLLDFVEAFAKAYQMTYPLTVSNRYA